MSRYDDALWDAADAAFGRVPPSGTTTARLELPVPHVGDDKWEGWREYELTLTLSEGVITEAVVTCELVPYRTSAAGPWRWRREPCGVGPVRLSAEDAQHFEEDFAMSMGDES